MHHRYRYCGLILDSELALPELAAMPCADSAADIRIVLEDVPPTLARARSRRTTCELGKGEALWRLEGVARYLVRDGGREIAVEPAGGAEAAAVRLFLLHPVFTLACILRGDWLLEASAVGVCGRAVALAGPSGSGKSTLAGALAARGHALLADGLLRVSAAADAGGAVLLAHPQAPWLLLWPDTLDQAAFGGLERGAAARESLHLRRCLHPAAPAPLPLSRIALLHEQRGDDLELFAADRKRGFRGFDGIGRLTAGIELGRVSGDCVGHLSWAAQIAARVPVERLDLPWGWDHLEACVDRLEAWCRS